MIKLRYPIVNKCFLLGLLESVCVELLLFDIIANGFEIYFRGLGVKSMQCVVRTLWVPVRYVLCDTPRNWFIILLPVKNTPYHCWTVVE